VLCASNERTMSHKNKKHRKWAAGCEHRSDKRTAEFLAGRLADLQEQLCDLIPDMRVFEHYGEIEDCGWCLRVLQRQKEKYRSFAENGVWNNE